MNIIIDKLYNHMKYYDLIFEWIYNEWGNNNPQYWKSWINSSVRFNGIPVTYIVFDDDIAIGTFSLWRCDLQSRQDLFPWFGAFYICPEYRGKSYRGSKLGYFIQNYALLCLKEWGYSEVYLFSEKGTDYYEKNGWIPIGESYDEYDRRVFLCRYDLELFETEKV